MPTLRRQLNVTFSPQAIFGERTGPFSAEPQKLFFMLNEPSPRITVEATDSITIAKRMAASVRYEQLALMSAISNSSSPFRMRRMILWNTHMNSKHNSLLRELD